MGYVIELNYLLKLPENFDTTQLKINQTITITKNGERLYPLHKPVEFCNHEYQYLGKVEITKLILENNQTTLEAKILSLFSEEDAAVFSRNFIK